MHISFGNVYRATLKDEGKGNNTYRADLMLREYLYEKNIAPDNFIREERKFNSTQYSDIYVFNGKNTQKDKAFEEAQKRYSRLEYENLSETSLTPESLLARASKNKYASMLGCSVILVDTKKIEKRLKALNKDKTYASKIKNITGTDIIRVTDKNNSIRPLHLNYIQILDILDIETSENSILDYTALKNLGINKVPVVISDDKTLKYLQENGWVSKSTTR